MSSLSVRTDFKNHILLIAPTENLVDLTAEFEELKDVLRRNNITTFGHWLGVQFIGSMEEPISVDATNTRGKFREYGAIYLHVVDRSKIGVGDSILARSEALRNSLRGIRINDMVIEKVSPPNFEAGSTLDFQGGYSSATIVVEYHKDINL